MVTQACVACIAADEALATASTVFCTKYIAAVYDVLEIPEAAAQYPELDTGTCCSGSHSCGSCGSRQWSCIIGAFCS